MSYKFANFTLYSCWAYIQKLNFIFKNGVTCYSYVLGTLHCFIIWATNTRRIYGQLTLVMMQKPELILALSIIGMKKKHDFWNSETAWFCE